MAGMGKGRSAHVSARPLTPALRRQRLPDQPDLHSKLQVSQSYILRSCVKTVCVSVC